MTEHKGGMRPLGPDEERKKVLPGEAYCLDCEWMVRGGTEADRLKAYIEHRKDKHPKKSADPQGPTSC